MGDVRFYFFLEGAKTKTLLFSCTRHRVKGGPRIGWRTKSPCGNTGLLGTPGTHGIAGVPSMTSVVCSQPEQAWGCAGWIAGWYWERVVAEWDLEI